MKRVDRTVFKKCPECNKQCPVALRSCNCGYAFTRTRPSRQTTKQKEKAQTQTQSATSSRSSSSSKGEPPADPDLDKVGRRFRTKRMRPDYFNSMELEYASKTFRTRKPKQEEKHFKGKKKRGRPKGSSGVSRKPKEDKRKEEAESKALPELEDLYANFSPQKMQQFSFILDELNFKMSSQIFKPL